ncbi:P-loop containing nucleoside triphosphate hydrolase protein [Schizopora paradoxa]|uniref:p-loop containing nucleoside triphosphate hydrolase protein n=1 Tax=Schizopora paradoxa TaxID=27342 RepID=A0A0H2R6U1_9AGAM|nr:P-loop containing nucleoside triphosphate hydrolase protein [Schizopora paradoxa]
MWIRRDSKQVPEPKKKKEHAEFAFIVLRTFNLTSDPTIHNITTTYEIQSPQLRKIGKKVIGHELGISWTATTVSVTPEILMAFLPHLEEHLKSLRSKQSQASSVEEDLSVDIEHLSFLINFVKKEHASTLKEIKSLLANEEITYDLAWALFVPRTILYTLCPISQVPRAIRLVKATQSCGWLMNVDYMEYHGEEPRFGLAPLSNIAVPKFRGAMKITSLPVYPIKYHPKCEELKKSLVERGKKWVRLQGVYLKYYNAVGIQYRIDEYIKLHTQSRIVIDKKMFQQIQPNYFIPSVAKTLKGKALEASVVAKQGNKLKPTPALTEEVVDPENPPWKDLRDEDLLIASPLVYGFSLSDKLWMEFLVEDVESFTWNDEPFTNLVLARDQKSLISSLVEAHAQDNSGGFDDFVHGKGQGLVINLFGNPGIGKSLTAEATSEHVRKPLYVVGAGDLGTDPQTLDLTLTRIFTISSRWGAVVLIDEADVFLEERSLHDLLRNAMVAVFLRQLEYFRGILFLTTNRVRAFDEAFQSRIHVSLRYLDLTSDAKSQIWVAFFKKARADSPCIESAETIKSGAELALTAGLTRDELHELAEKPVNGRQIKNVVRTANALAKARKQLVGFSHLIEVLDMMEQFEAV